MNFSFSDSTQLVVPDIVLKKVIPCVDKEFINESGGIFLGSYDPDLKEYRVTDFILPLKKEDCSLIHFVREKNRANRFIEKAWKSSKGKVNYLGEWHTHNEVNPHPSGTDRRLMFNIVNDKSCVFNNAFMLIFGSGGGVFCAKVDKDGDGSFSETSRSQWKEKPLVIGKQYWDHGISDIDNEDKENNPNDFIYELEERVDDIESELSDLSFAVDDLDHAIYKTEIETNKLLLDIQNVSEITGFSIEIIFDMIKNDKIPWIYIYDNVYFNSVIIIEWLQDLYSYCAENNGIFKIKDMPNHDFNSCHFNPKMHKLPESYLLLE